MEKNKGGIMKLLLAISLIGLFFLYSCNEDGSYKDDNIAEEILEEVIEQKFNIDVDLTPSSEEQHDLFKKEKE